jgi:hypothetical protein
VPNAFLVAQRTKFEGLRASIQQVQDTAVTEKRDLTEDELRSITEFAAQADTVGKQIEQIVDVETRAAKVAGLAASISDAADGDGQDTADTGTQLDGTRSKAADDDKDGADQTRSRRTKTTTRDRDPGHYTRSSDNSFFRDIYRAKTSDDDSAMQRLAEHNRALTTGSHGPGVVPPHWLTEEFELLARQGRKLAGAVRNIPLGDDPRPMTLPKQIAGTDAVVAEQAAENTAVGGADAWDSDVDIVTPKPTAGKQIMSRQMLDMSNPAVDQLIYGDLLSVYNLQVEQKVGAAMVTAAGAPVVTLATEAAFNGVAPAVPAYDAAVDTSMAVWNARKIPADIIAMTVNRWGKYKKLKDTTGRPLIPAETAGLMNVIGVGDVQMAGQIDSIGVIPTDGIGSGSAYPESVIVARAADTILFEGTTMRFRFEEQAGPESIVLGIWGYTAVIVRQATKSVKRFQITAA